MSGQVPIGAYLFDPDDIAQAAESLLIAVSRVRDVDGRHTHVKTAHSASWDAAKSALAQMVAAA